MSRETSRTDFKITFKISQVDYSQLGIGYINSLQLWWPCKKGLPRAK